MFERLKDMFGRTAPAPATSSATTPSTATAGGAAKSPAAPTATASRAGSEFLRSEVIFERDGRPAGHLFRLQPTPGLAEAGEARQRQFDRILLDTLVSTPQDWHSSLAFVPISAASLDLPAVDRLPTGNFVLLIRLAEAGDAEQLGQQLARLRERGRQIGVFRQPEHPLFPLAFAAADFAAIDVAGNDPAVVRDFSVAARAAEHRQPIRLLALNISSLDEYRLGQQWHYAFFHGRFAELPSRHDTENGDPHKVLLLQLLHLVQGDADNADIVRALKRDPLLAFRILRYLNSPLLGLNHAVDSLDQALTILGRQQLSRWLAILLFSVRDPDFADWLQVESALTRGRLMELLGRQLMPDQAAAPLFLTGIFSCLERLLHRPLAGILDTMPLSAPVRAALLAGNGPYAPLLSLAIASEGFDTARIAQAALAAGIDADGVNRALLAATAWASEMTEHWE